MPHPVPNMPRQGMDQSYRPFHVVRYFRYLRLFPDGTALALTTADQPSSIVNGLRTKDPPASFSNALRGHYEQTAGRLLLTFGREHTHVRARIRGGCRERKEKGGRT